MRRRNFVRILSFVLLAVGFAISAAATPNSPPKPDPDPDGVIVLPLLVRYTAGFLSNGRLRGLQIAGRDLDKIRRHFKQVITTNLASGFSIVSKPGPRVVLVDAVLVDHALDKREWFAPTRRVFRSAPRVQLIAYLRDSQTGEVFDRVGLTLRPHANRLMMKSSGEYWHFMRRVFDRVATRLRWALEDGASAS